MVSAQTPCSCYACFRDAIQLMNSSRPGRHYAKNAMYNEMTRNPRQRASSLRSSNTPMAVECPSALLALFAAIFCSAASTALSKLPRERLPFTALVIGTLSNATSGIVLATEIAHYDPGPVLHIGAMISYCELLDQGENIKVVGQQIFLFVFLLAQ